jgi:cytoskeleton protein RodZ
MDLRELGALLKAERERRGLSENDVIDRIKIGRACLIAIEDGDQGGLPHPVYAKGFIKNYAKLLDLDPEEVGEAFSRAVGVVPESHIAPQHELNEPVTQTRMLGGGGGILRYVLAALGILVVVAGVLWFFSLTPFDFKRSLPPAPGSEVSGTPSASVGQPSLETTRPEPGRPSLDKAPEPPAASLPVTEPAPSTAIPSVPAAADPATDPAAASRAAPAPLAADAEEPADPSLSPDVVLGEHGAHSVTIIARDECWIDVSVDGGGTKGIMLTKGKRFVGNFNESLLVRLGNAGGVEVRYDDKEYPLQAGNGEVKTLKFVTKPNGAPPQSPTTSLTTQVPVTPKTPAAGTPAAPPAAGTPAAPPAATATPAAPPAVSATPAAPPAAAVPPTGETAARPAGARSLDIIGADGSWVIVTTDGGKPREVFVKKGQTITEPYTDKIEVRLGNPSSVIFRHEGQETPLSTQRGEVKSIRFPNP